MEIVKLVILFLGMFLAADYVRKQTYARTASISENWMRRLANSFIWALAATVTGTVISLVLSMAMPPFVMWLVLFTVVDFVFASIRGQ